MVKRYSTKDILFQSLCELCKVKAIEKITVDDIVHNCGYKRGTFYYHFKDKEDLIISAMYQNTLDIHEKYFKTQDWSFIMKKNLEFCKEHEVLMQNLGKHKERFGHDLNDYMYKYVSQFVKEELKVEILPYKLSAMIHFYCAGASSVYGEWIEKGFKEDTNLVAEVLTCTIPVELYPIFRLTSASLI